MNAFTLADALATWEAIDAEVRAELARAHELHGGQHLPSGCDPDAAALYYLSSGLDNRELRDAAIQQVDVESSKDQLWWSEVVLEEVFEWLAEDSDTDPAAWRAEGVQVICTVVRALTDHRTSEGDRA